MPTLNSYFRLRFRSLVHNLSTLRRTLQWPVRLITYGIPITDHPGPSSSYQLASLTAGATKDEEATSKCEPLPCLIT